MVNPYRGEAELMIEGEAHVMRLSLGVLAELEADMQSDSLMNLVQRFEKGEFSARDLMALLCAGLRGGGADISVLELGKRSVDGGPVGAAQAAGRLLKVTFSAPE